MPSDDVCKRLASTENGASPRLSLAIGIWLRSAYSSSWVRLRRSHSRQGAITLIEGIGGQLKANLVIALAGRAMGNGICAGFLSNFDETLGDQRTGNGRAEQI